MAFTSPKGALKAFKDEISGGERLRRSFSVTLHPFQGSVSFEWSKSQSTDGRLSLKCRSSSWSKQIHLLESGKTIVHEPLPFKVYADCGIPKGGHTGGTKSGSEPTRIGYLTYFSGSTDEEAHLFAKFWLIPTAFEAVVDGIRRGCYPIFTLSVFGLEPDAERYFWRVGDPNLTIRENRELGLTNEALDVKSALVEIPLPEVR